MNKLEIKKFNPSILRNATLISNGKSFMSTFNLNNGKILKLVKPADQGSYSELLDHEDFVECLYDKVMGSRFIENPDVVLPNTAYFDDDNIVGYTVPYIGMRSASDLVFSNYNLDFLIDFFTTLSDHVKNANSEGIIFPDLGNLSNVLYDPKSSTVKFIDFDGIQLRDCESFNVSKLMSKFDNPIFSSSKYFDIISTLFTPEFDKATLITLFVIITTFKNLTNFKREDFEVINRVVRLKKESLDKFINDIGLSDTSLADDIRKLYDDSSNNNYLTTSIRRLKKTHILDKSTHSFKKI